MHHIVHMRMASMHGALNPMTKSSGCIFHYCMYSMIHCTGVDYTAKWLPWLQPKGTANGYERQPLALQQQTVNMCKLHRSHDYRKGLAVYSHGCYSGHCGFRSMDGFFSGGIV